MWRKVGPALLVAAIAVGFAWYVSGEPMDYRVYHYAAQKVFDEGGPVYGEQSGLGWPMHYRYPPPFLFLARPLALLPLSWGAALFVMLKCGALALLVRALWKRLGPSTGKTAWLVPLLLAGPYVVEDLRYGNAQSFIFALTGVALLSLATPLLAAAALALAISIKVWPLYFVPYLAARRQWRVVGATLAFTAVILMAPALYFGFDSNMRLLSEWVTQEFSTQTSASEIWFPNQSLRGVMMRYLTVIDYTRMPDPNYPLVQVAAISPSTVRTVSLMLVGLLYLGVIAITVRRKDAALGLTEALAFTGLILLQPFSQKYALVVLLWPAIVAGRLVGQDARGRVLVYAAIAAALVQPLIKGAAAQRLLQALGFDFLATALLAAFLIVSILTPPTERYARG
jgi:hypothetical protein